MTPIITDTLRGLSYARAFEKILKIISGPGDIRTKMTVLNIVINNDHVRRLARAHAERQRETMYPETITTDMEAIMEGDFWDDPLGQWTIGYEGNMLYFFPGAEGFKTKETNSFLEEWHMPFVEAAAIHSGEWPLLGLLAKNDWASPSVAVNHAVELALKKSGSRESWRTFEAALRMGMFRPERVRRLLLLVDWRATFCDTTSNSTTVTAFEICSLQPPNSKTAAKILCSLLKTLKMGEAWYPAFTLPFLRHAFMAALRTAVKAGGGTSQRLRVLETWLECCQDILVPEGHTHWRMALRTGNAELLREVLCVRMGFVSEFDLEEAFRLDWRLKVDLP
jgi:hypothetical protein